MCEIDNQSSHAFYLRKGDILTVIDPQGMQISDMVLFNREDFSEKISSEKTLHFEESILITKENFLWSNRSRKMMLILEDTNGRNDFLLSPCSKGTSEILINNTGSHPSCFENLARNLRPMGITRDEIPAAFNIFGNVQFDEKGKLSVLPPTSKAGNHVQFLALMDLLVCLTACSAENSTGGRFKPIHYTVVRKHLFIDPNKNI